MLETQAGVPGIPFAPPHSRPTMIPVSASAWTERDVATGAGPVALHGTLTLPEDAAPTAGVLILAGSGPVDRDGNLPGLPNNSLKLLAHRLAECGFVSLRADKRGTGASCAGR